VEGRAAVTAGVMVPELVEIPEHHALRVAVRDACRDLSPPSAVLAAWSSGTHDQRLWKALAADIGVAGLLIPEQYGGSDAGLRAAAVVAEELGRAVAAVPYLPTAALAATALRAAGDGAAEAMRAIVDGAVVVLAVPITQVIEAEWPEVIASAGDSAVLLTGVIPMVLAAAQAEKFVVPAMMGAEPVLVLVVSTPALVREQGTQLDETRPFADLCFDGTPATVIAAGAAASNALRNALLAGTTVLAAEQLGVADQAFEDCVDYLRTRHQFGRPLGSFQALRHRAADLWTALTGARAVVRYASACLDEGDADAELATYLAAAVCSELCLRVTEESLQLYGGYGFTWEAPLHLYLKRAAANLPLLGTAERHRAAIARLVDLPPN
jgi:alkylation response protein AidB-like acyl-CoA dehydrogenase